MTKSTERRRKRYRRKPAMDKFFRELGKDGSSKENREKVTPQSSSKDTGSSISK